jgi:hypothetical protein
MSNPHVARAQLRFAAGLCAVLAVGWLFRLSWPPRFLAIAVADPVRTAAVLMIVLNGLQIHVLLVFRSLLSSRVGATSSGQFILALVAVLGIDLLASIYLLVSGAPGYQTYTSPLGPYMLVVAYPLLSQLALATLLIAFGYSVRRIVQDRDPTLRWYAQTQIVAGFGFASLTLAPLAALSMVAGYGLLAAAFWDMSRGVARIGMRHAIGHGTPNMTLPARRIASGATGRPVELAGPTLARTPRMGG